MEGFADLADLERRVWAVEVPAAEMRLAEREVYEDAAWAEGPAADAVVSSTQ